jgi:hypothetical protein
MVAHDKHQHRTEDETGHKETHTYQERTGIFIILATAACILGYIMSLDPRGRHGAIIAFYIAWCLIGAAIAALYWESRKQSENPLPAALPPATPMGAQPSSTPKLRFSVKREWFAVKVGGMTAGFKADDPPHAVMKIGNIDAVTAQIVEGKLVVNAQLFNANVKLIGDELTGMPPRWDSNFDETAIEIVDDKGQPMFQMEYVSDQMAVLYGFFVVGDRAIVAYDDKLTGTPATQEGFARFKLAPIFKYPSARHRGERVKP